MDGPILNPFKCREITTQIALGGIERASWTRRAAIRFHLVICWLCRKYERQLRVISKSFALNEQAFRRRYPSTALKTRLYDAFHL